MRGGRSDYEGDFIQEYRYIGTTLHQFAWNCYSKFRCERYEWFEAKYNHMANLSVKSVEDARLACNHFKVLHPELGPEKLRAQFLELEAKLAK